MMQSGKIEITVKKFPENMNYLRACTTYYVVLNRYLRNTHELPALCWVLDELDKLTISTDR